MQCANGNCASSRKPREKYLEGHRDTDIREMLAKRSLQADSFDFEMLLQSTLSDLSNLGDLINSPRSRLVHANEVEHAQCTPRQSCMLPVNLVYIAHTDIHFQMRI